MIRGTTENPKFKRLMRRLDLRKYQCAGLLEMLWEFTAAQALDGGVGKWSNEDIAVALDWTGNEDDLVAALVACKWLDEDEQHRLIVHDWSKYADDHVQLKLGRQTRLFADGRMPRLKRLSTKERDRILQAYKQAFGEAILDRLPAADDEEAEEKPNAHAASNGVPPTSAPAQETSPHNAHDVRTAPKGKRTTRASNQSQSLIPEPEPETRKQEISGKLLVTARGPGDGFATQPSSESPPTVGALALQPALAQVLRAPERSAFRPRTVIEGTLDPPPRNDIAEALKRRLMAKTIAEIRAARLEAMAGTRGAAEPMTEETDGF